MNDEEYGAIVEEAMKTYIRRGDIFKLFHRAAFKLTALHHWLLSEF